jgi:hypothetical protein
MTLTQRGWELLVPPPRAVRALTIPLILYLSIIMEMFMLVLLVLMRTMCYGLLDSQAHCY